MDFNIQNVTLERTAGLASQFPKNELPQIAFSGRSNVGKSSLINGLLGRKKLARVSAAPGKTITVNYYNIDRRFYLVDLPGYGFAKRPQAEREKWSALTEAYFAGNDRLRLVVQLIDMRIGPTKDDDVMLSWLYETGTPYIIVATKADKLNKTDRAAMLDALNSDQMILEGTRVIPSSSLEGTGKEEIWAAIRHILSANR